MAEEQQPGDYITCPKCPLSQKGKKTEPPIGNLPNWVIQSVKPNLCNKDGQLVTSTCTNIVIIDSIHTKPVDMPRL